MYGRQQSRLDCWRNSSPWRSAPSTPTLADLSCWLEMGSRLHVLFMKSTDATLWYVSRRRSTSWRKYYVVKIKLKRWGLIRFCYNLLIMI